MLAATALATLLRLHGLHFGLPQSMTRPDEEAVVGVVVRILHSGNPNFFDYPTFFMYVAALVQRIVLGDGALDGGVPALLIDRLLSALFGIATVPLVFVIARRLFSTTAAIGAAFLLAIAFLHVRDSHFGVTDVPMAFMTMLAFWVMVTPRLDGARWWRAAAAGLACGLATSTKYNAAVIALPLAVLLVQQNPARRWPVLFAAAGAGMAAGFLAGTPYAWITPQKFIADVLGVREHLAVGHAVDQGPGWIHHLTFSLRYGLGVPFLAAALVGAALLAVENRRRAAVVLSFPLAYYLVLGSGRTVFVRYMIPLVPFAALLAGYAIDRAAAAIAAALGRGLVVHVAAAAVLVCAAGADATARSIALGRLLSRQDSRVLAAEWVRARYPAGVTTYQNGSAYLHVKLDPEGIYPQSLFDEARGRFVRFDEPIDGPRIVILQRTPLVAYSQVPDALPPLLAREYRLAERIEVRSPGAGAEPVFDQQDAFVVPLAGFDRLTRPGPSIEIYERLR